jgi:hypothetical protein
MDALLTRLEAMGRSGGWVALGLAAASVPVVVGLGWAASEADGWSAFGLGFPAALLAAAAMVLAFVGTRLLTQRHYPSAAEVFPPLPREAFATAVQERDEPVCACTRCRVVLSAAFSTGSCPVCASSVDYYEVTSDEDAEMVVMALP